MEYSGSFDKDEVIHNLTTNEGFRMQGCAVDANKTILDNSDQVGNYMETVQGVTTRCKIYNKMIQMLESKSVRETVAWAALEGLGMPKEHSFGQGSPFSQRSWFNSGRGDVLLRILWRAL
jgi:hypothetical protein